MIDHWSLPTSFYTTLDDMAPIEDEAVFNDPNGTILDPPTTRMFLVDFVFDYILPAKAVNAKIAKNDIVSWILVIYFSFGVLTAKG